MQRGKEAFSTWKEGEGRGGGAGERERMAGNPSMGVQREPFSRYISKEGAWGCPPGARERDERVYEE